MESFLRFPIEAKEGFFYGERKMPEKIIGILGGMGP
jgi:hypothetical protein